MDEAVTLLLKIANSIMVGILGIYGVFIVFAIFQDRSWNDRFGPLWLFVPNIVPAWISCVCFYIYLGLTNDDKYILLLLSVHQFPWIFNNTYSMFCTTYLDMSSQIYEHYDAKTLTQFEEHTKALPQNEYLVHGLFRLLEHGQDFSTWTSQQFVSLPSVHPHILNVFAQYIESDLYKFEDIEETVEARQTRRDRIAMFLVPVISVLTVMLSVLIWPAVQSTELVNGYLLSVMVVDVLLFIAHLVFSRYTIKVLLYLGNSVQHVMKYKVALTFSFFIMFTEFAVLVLVMVYGMSDDTWSLNLLILSHSVGLLGWYTTWVVEQVYVSMHMYSDY